MILKDYKLTQDEFNQSIQPLALDLQAYYNIMQQAVLEVIDMGARQGWTPDKVIQEIDRMFGDEGNRLLPHDGKKPVEKII